ncbi:hypothetical protein HDV05_008092 [Chytridiales sp. JEL 0842]|nr:hypothetical protein HDV05_008092 [Chytridiales sp. JEL 0842]
MTAGEGRNFYSNPSTKLYIQCRFNNEILTTDPTEHTSDPTWDTELEWDIDAKPLGFLRSQRAKLKLICYEIDAYNHRSQLGYVMLDLRMASVTKNQASKTVGDGQQQPTDKKKPGWTWYPLINYTGPNASVFRPELKLSFSVTPKITEIINPSPSGLPFSADVRRGRQQSAQNRGSEPRSRSGSLQPYRDRLKSLSPSPRVVQLPASDLAARGYITASGLPVELAEAGYFQIGTQGPHWIFNLTIAFAENLQVLQDTIPPEALALDSDASTSTGFYFYYNFLGSDIITERFYDLQSPTFPSERISFRIRSSEEDFLQFLKDTDRLVVHLCKNGIVVGFAEVNLQTLVQALQLEDDEIDGADKEDGRISPALAMASNKGKRKGPRVVEEVYNVFNSKQELPVSVDGRSPNLGISIVIVADAAADNEEELQTKGESKTLSSTARAVKVTIEPKSERKETAEGLDMTNSKSDQPSKNNTSAAPPQTETAENVQSTPPQLTWHQYRFSIDLRSVRGLSPKTGSIYLKYSYAPFGSTSPTITYPAVTPVAPISSTAPPAELLIPHSFCAFEFVMSPERLDTYLQAVPLVVEVLSKDLYEKDTVVGSVTIDLSTVRKKPKFTDTSASALSGSIMKEITIQSTELTNLIISPVETELGGQVKQIGEMRAILALEDFGIVAESEVLEETASKIEDDAYSEHSHYADTKYDSNRNAASKLTFSDIPTASSSNRKSTKLSIPDITRSGQIEYPTIDPKAIQDLEQWKRLETKKFRAHLRTLESNLLNSLTSEFATRDAARSELVTTKLKDLENLETQTKSLAIDLEDRERKLKRAEEDLERRKQDLEREFQKREEEARNNARILGEEFKARMEVERIKVSESESGKMKACLERDELERRLKSLENEYMEFKKKAMDGKVLGVSAEGVSEAAVAAIRKELAHVASAASAAEKRCRDLEAAKKHYKSQWIKTLRELAKLKNHWQMEVKENLAKSNRELDSMKLKLLAKEEIEVIAGERKVFNEMRRVIEDLKGGNNEEYKPKSYSNWKDTRDGDAKKKKKENLDPRLRVEIERLAGERDSLVKSGMYTREDKLIRELDARIAKADAMGVEGAGVEALMEAAEKNEDADANRAPPGAADCVDGEKADDGIDERLGVVASLDDDERHVFEATAAAEDLHPPLKLALAAPLNILGVTYVC